MFLQCVINSSTCYEYDMKRTHFRLVALQTSCICLAKTSTLVQARSCMGHGGTSYPGDLQNKTFAPPV